MSGMEPYPGGVLEAANPVSGDVQVPASVLEREARLQETLAIVEAVSAQAGQELDQYAVESPADIPDVPGIYVMGDYRECGPVARTTFEMRRILLSGARNSGHNIIAGKLDVEYADGTERDVEVAAKCFVKRTPEERYERAMREITVNQEMLERGEIALEPIALAITEQGPTTDGEIVLVTRQRRGLLSLDNNPWSSGLEAGTNRTDALLMLQALGRFNVHGFRHGDAKTKNAVVDESRGDGEDAFGMLDFETTTPSDPDDPIEAATTAFIDYGSMMNSLRRKGLFGQSEASTLAVALDDLAEAYLANWADAPEAVHESVTQSVITVNSQLFAELQA